MSPRLRDWPNDPDADRPATRLPTAAFLYREAIKALARRELTSRQLQDRLTALGGRAADVAAVITRLQADGALDDRRAARIYAQTAFRQRKRARARIEAELEALGISREIARDITDEVCSLEIERSRLEHLVIFALRGTRRDHRDDEARRLFGHLKRQGYDTQDIVRAFARAGIDASFEDGGL